MVDAMETAAIGKDLVGTVIDGRFTLIQWLGGSAAGEVFLTEADGQRAVIKLAAADDVGAKGRIAAWTATSTDAPLANRTLSGRLRTAPLRLHRHGI
jgi:hypothetical protein